MSKRLKELFEKKFPASLSSISDIARKEFGNSKCTCKDPAFDFDIIKTEMSKILNISSPKSCDCLFINDGKDIIYLAEMKSFKNVVIYNKDKFSTRIDYEVYFNEYIANFIKGFGLDDKIIDSYALILSILWKFKLGDDLYTNFLDREKIKIKFLIILDISAKDYVVFELSSLGKIQRYLKYRFLDYVDILKCEDFCPV